MIILNIFLCINEIKIRSLGWITKYRSEDLKSVEIYKFKSDLYYLYSNSKYGLTSVNGSPASSKTPHSCFVFALRTRERGVVENKFSLPGSPVNGV